MEALKTYVLDKVVAWVLGGSMFNQIKDIVSSLSNMDVPGDVKREQALKQLKMLGYDTATFLINLGIEAAVFLLKEKQSKA